MSVLSGMNLVAADTTQQFALGTETEVKGTQWKYFEAGEALAQYALCIADEDDLAVEATTTLSGSRPSLFCIPQFAVSSGEFFWAPVGPIAKYREDGTTRFQVKAALDCAENVKLYTTATDGVVDDAATDLIAGLQLTETITAAAAADCIAVCRMVSNCQD